MCSTAVAVIPISITTAIYFVPINSFNTVLNDNLCGQNRYLPTYCFKIGYVVVLGHIEFTG